MNKALQTLCTHMKFLTEKYHQRYIKFPLSHVTIQNTHVIQKLFTKIWKHYVVIVIQYNTTRIEYNSLPSFVILLLLYAKHQINV